MGEAKRRQLAVQTQALEAMVVDTPGGRIHVQWDHGASATPTTGVYDSWINSCPLSYTSPNAHSKRDVLGTWLLAILAGHNRYAHITGLRGDAVSPQILGMDKIISEDALRRSLSRMSEEQSQAWLVPQLLSSVQAALSTPWILDIDTTIGGCQDSCRKKFDAQAIRWFGWLWFFCVSGLRWTSVIRLQLRVGPDQRFGLASRAAPYTLARSFRRA